jgi:hypothetical protein
MPQGDSIQTKLTPSPPPKRLPLARGAPLPSVASWRRAPLRRSRSFLRFGRRPLSGRCRPSLRPPSFSSRRFSQSARGRSATACCEWQSACRRRPRPTKNPRRKLARRAPRRFRRFDEDRERPSRQAANRFRGRMSLRGRMSFLGSPLPGFLQVACLTSRLSLLGVEGAKLRRRVPSSGEVAGVPLRTGSVGLALIRTCT